ncbi:MAG: MCE family protein [Acidobacteriota bacterium]|nr:MCE family protein [Acidobacteriota bacterium]
MSARGTEGGAGTRQGTRRHSVLTRWLHRREEVPYADIQRARRPLRFGLTFIAILAIALYFAIAKKVPFTHGYRLHAVFGTALNMPSGTPVRIAGVNAGTVTALKRVGDAADVEMEITSIGLPIHRDATLKVRPRLFLEGSFFVELHPGSPASPTLSSGATIPITQTADPVQLEAVLDALNTDTRSNLQTFLIEYGKALAEKPTAAQDAEQEPEDRGLNAAQALDRAARHGPIAAKGSAIVNQALAGTHERDLSTLVASVNRVTRGLDANSTALGELIVNFNTFLEEFAHQSSSLHAAVGRLPHALGAANRAFTELDAAFPAVRSFSLALIPGVEQTPPTVAAFLPWIAQARGLFGAGELGGIAKSLREGAPAVAALVNQQTPFLHQNELFSRCLTNVLIPAGNVKLEDGSNSSGETAYREFWYGLVGANGIGQSFSGNGLNGLRGLVGGGGETITATSASVIGSHEPSVVSAREPLASRTALPPLGTRPRFPATEPSYQPLVPCYKQALPSFNGPLAGPGPADGSAP